MVYVSIYNSCPLLQGDTKNKSSALSLFTGGKGQKKMIGRVQWNEEGLKYYKRAERNYREMYQQKEQMDIIYRGWEQWLLNVSNRKSTSFIPFHESSNKTLHSIMGTWTWSGEKEDGSNEGRLRDDSDSEEVSDDDKGFFSDSETKIIRRWAKPPPHVTSNRQSSPDKSVESVMTGVDDVDADGTKMEGSTKHNSTASKDESEGLDDGAAAGKDKKKERKTTVTSGKGKRGGLTLTSSPAKNTRASKLGYLNE